MFSWPQGGSTKRQGRGSLFQGVQTGLGGRIEEHQTLRRALNATVGLSISPFYFCLDQNSERFTIYFRYEG